MTLQYTDCFELKSTLASGSKEIYALPLSTQKNLNQGKLPVTRVSEITFFDLAVGQDKLLLLTSTLILQKPLEAHEEPYFTPSSGSHVLSVPFLSLKLSYRYRVAVSNSPMQAWFPYTCMYSTWLFSLANQSVSFLFDQTSQKNLEGRGNFVPPPQ